MDSLSVRTIGFSQKTGTLLARQAFRCSRWRWFGEPIITRSRGAAAYRASIEANCSPVSIPSAAAIVSRGGMYTKIEAAKIATTAGTHMLIASGKIEHPLQAIADGGRCTWFLTPANPVTARKRWIAGSLEPKGTLTIDAGAVSALRAGKSLLPAGVIRIDGQFARGDAVIVRGPDTHEIGRGLVAYDAEDAEKIKGRSSPDVMTILGISGRAEMIHRDDLVIGPSAALPAGQAQS